MPASIVLLATCLVICASLSLAIRGGDHPMLARKLASDTNPTAPNGWWQSISVTVGSKQVYCGLRDFPPIPDGYGSSRMLCGGDTAAYDPYWVWQLSKVSNSSAAITTGDLVNLRIFNPMFTYCAVTSASQVICGVPQDKATPFSVEKVGTTTSGSAINFQTDNLYLKSGSLYCSVRIGKGNSQYVYCNQPSAAKATVFKIPYTHYYSVSVTSNLNSNACGANFIPLTGDTSAVNCTTNNYIPSNYVTKHVFSTQSSGPQFLSSGTPYSITSYEQLYHYQVSAWSATKSGAVYAISNDTEDAGLWFIFEAAGAAPGTALSSGQNVAIKSSLTGKYCCLSSATAQLMCNQPVATGAGCQFNVSF